MNPTRSTAEPTVLDWLNIIQRGNTEEWRRLYRLCRDPVIARDVASVLPMRDPDQMACAQLWKYLLQDLHPELEITLRPEPRGTGA